jgi:DNA-directed RNA polymerase
LDRLHRGNKAVSMQLLGLAYEAKLVQDFRSLRSHVTACVEPSAPYYTLHHVLTKIESDMQRGALRKPNAKPWIKQNGASYEKPRWSKGEKREYKNDPKSRPSPITERAARAVQATPWRVNQWMLDVLERCPLPDLQSFETDYEEARAELTTLSAAHVCSSKCRRLTRGPEKGKMKHAREPVFIAAIQNMQKKRSAWDKVKHDHRVLDVARGRGDDVFYIPVHFDYRGRLYQDGTLNYTGGSDLARGLLEFGRGKRLSELADPDDAIEAMEIHIASCYGAPGVWPDTDRKLWTELHWQEIGDAIEAPEDNEHFWRRAKHPYPFLAAAHALHSARTEDAELHVPVAFDATNSGLQHYCLLLRDQSLAPYVNLGTSPKPLDLYRHLSDDAHVRALLKVDDDKQRREDVKEIVKKLMYGAAVSTTAEALADEGEQFTKEEYEIAVAVRDAMWRQMPLVEELLGWFRDTARAPRGLSWTTPSKFVVRQYSRVQIERPDLSRRTVLRSLGEIQQTARGPSPEIFDRDAQARQLAANFVQSMDAALLALVIDAGSKVDLVDWASAHDSFGVPPWQWRQLLVLASLMLYEMHIPNTLAAVAKQWGLKLPPFVGLHAARSLLEAGITAGNINVLR